MMRLWPAVFLLVLGCTPKDKTIPLDPAPDASMADAGQTIATITLAADGKMTWNNAPVANDDALMDLARAAHLQSPDLRVVIKADSDASHGSTIHVLDVLKQAGVSKVAYGVAPLPDASKP